VRISRTVIAALVLLALAGCTGASTARTEPSAAASSAASAGGSPSGGSAAGPSGRSSAGASPTAGAAPVNGVLISYGREGGLAGIDEQLTIAPDGSYELTRDGGAPKKGKLSPADLARLRQVLDASHFADVPAVNPGPPGADLFTYRVAYGQHEVLAEDGGIPPALSPVLAALGDVVSRTT
jgi:hypothetical protein